MCAGILLEFFHIVENRQNKRVHIVKLVGDRALNQRYTLVSSEMNNRDLEKCGQLCGCVRWLCAACGVCGVSVWCLRCGHVCVAWCVVHVVCVCYVCACACVCGMWRLCDVVYDMQCVCVWMRTCMWMRTVCVRRFYPPEATLLATHMNFPWQIMEITICKHPA
jgi:hypothetical protein